MKTLYLPLKKEWYEMIERGEKTEEYREITRYWCSRLLDCWREDGSAVRCGWVDIIGNPCAKECSFINKIQGQYDAVCFSYGYTKRRMTFECKGITIGRGCPEWGAPNYETFIIKLGKRI